MDAQKRNNIMIAFGGVFMMLGAALFTPSPLKIFAVVFFLLGTITIVARILTENYGEISPDQAFIKEPSEKTAGYFLGIGIISILGILLMISMILGNRIELQANGTFSYPYASIVKPLFYTSFPLFVISIIVFAISQRRRIVGHGFLLHLPFLGPWGEKTGRFLFRVYGLISVIAGSAAIALAALQKLPVTSYPLGGIMVLFGLALFLYGGYKE
ncbi:MAG: hypothetical protein ABIG20_03770 [archaeon]